MIPDLDDVAARMRLTAREEILPRFKRLAAHEIAQKSPGNLVTIADTEAERRLSALLTALVPDAVVVGEEAVAADAAILDRLSGERPVWVIDPVDGTGNFAKANPVFAVIVAYVERGATRAGWILDPVADVAIAAAEGRGAWRDGSRLAIDTELPLARMTGNLYGRFEGRGTAREIGRNSGRLGGLSHLGSAGREYMELAESKRHFALYSRAWPWDHAAGVLIHREAGGHAAFLDGTPYEPTRREGRLLMAPSPGSWRALRSLLLGDPVRHGS